MKNIKGMAGLAVFLTFLWAVVVSTYASQVRSNALTGKDADLFPTQTPTSCSSSSSSSGSE